MTESIKHDLRLSEVITPFGVGAIVDVRGESLIAADTSWWEKKYAAKISCDRLVARIGAGELREPPTHAGRTAKDTPALDYWRFPAWRFCERCTKLTKITGKERGRWVNRCECGGHLVPMRYVAVCKKGSHIQDIPWFMWAHRGSDASVTEAVRVCRAYKELRFIRSSSHGEGLASLRVFCNGCKRSRSLSDIVTPDALARDGIKCDSRQPWEAEDSVSTPCEHHLVAVQRGATGNYLAERLSALDIPEERPESIELVAKVRNHVLFEMLLNDNGGPLTSALADQIGNDLGVTKEDVLIVAGADPSDDETPLLDLKDGDWGAFSKKLEQGRDRSASDFVVDGWAPSDETPGPDELKQLVAGVGQVRRVREVRALLGFRRHDPDADLIGADLGPDRRRRPVYPAIELFGEGIFLRFSEEAVAKWERDAAVQARANILIGRRSQRAWAHRLDLPEPRYIALHTLSHLLIRRLAFASGYSSASLQERIYANSSRPDHTAGILIYTAAGDAQGTLGGLVRLGAPDKLIPMIIAALDDADVCSNDPVCIESDRQGSAQLNLSACHGCSLISETSCESRNLLLDRQLVLGGTEVRGLLDAVLPAVRRSLIVSS